jgi:hypothetical protein
VDQAAARLDGTGSLLSAITARIQTSAIFVGAGSFTIDLAGAEGKVSADLNASGALGLSASLLLWTGARLGGSAAVLADASHTPFGASLLSVGSGLNVATYVILSASAQFDGAGVFHTEPTEFEQVAAAFAGTSDLDVRVGLVSNISALMQGATSLRVDADVSSDKIVSAELIGRVAQIVPFVGRRPTNSATLVGRVASNGILIGKSKLKKLAD